MTIIEKWKRLDNFAPMICIIMSPIFPLFRSPFNTPQKHGRKTYSSTIIKGDHKQSPINLIMVQIISPNVFQELLDILRAMSYDIIGLLLKKYTYFLETPFLSYKQPCRTFPALHIYIIRINGVPWLSYIR